MKRTKRMWCGVGILLLLVTATSGWCSLFSREVLGVEAGVLHPFLSFSGEYTDNLFKTDDEKDDFVSYITPGLWVALPGADLEVVNIATSSSIPGGMAQTRFQAEDMGRYQGYFRYAPTFENYVDFDERDFTSHQMDAYAAVNLAGGLSFELMDQYTDSRDDVEEETDSAEFNNNLINLTTSYAITDKMTARLDLGRYDVNYDSRAPEKDRVDMSAAGYLFFSVLPKTTVFGELSHVDIDYDSVNKDSQELKFFGGVKYNATDRIDAMFKLGMMSKEMDATGDTHNSLSMEGAVSYLFTDRISLLAFASRANKETTIGSSEFATETLGRVTCSYALSSRTEASLYCSLTEEEYNSIDRDDTTFMLSPSLRYDFNNRIFGTLAYSFEDRDASGRDTLPRSSYTENSVMVSVTATM